MGRPGAKVIVKYVQQFVDRHGRPRCYYRRAGYPRVALPDPSEPGFWQAYEAAATAGETQTPKLRGGEGSFDRLVSAYYQSTQFKRLKPTTAAVYRNILDGFCEKHGRRLVRQMKRRHVDTIISEMSATPGAANSFLKRLKTLMVYAVQNEWIDRDPTYRMRAYKAGEVHTWTEEQISFFETHWEIGTKERLMFELALSTGQRRSDLYRMKWSDYNGKTIYVVQQKTGAKLEIPTPLKLRRLLDAIEHHGETIIVTEYNKPFASAAAFGNRFADAVRAVSILPKRCSLHGLRKSAARRLAEAGCSSSEIGSITGHKTLGEIERYTRAADQKRLAESAMKKQTAHKRVKPKSR